MGMDVSSNRDCGGARAFVKSGWLNCPSWGKRMPSVLHSKSCWGHTQCRAQLGRHSERTKSEHRAMLLVMDPSEMELSRESDPCLVATGAITSMRHLSARYRGNRNKTQQVTCSQQDAQASWCLSALREISQEGGSQHVTPSPSSVLFCICFLFKWYFGSLCFSDRVLNCSPCYPETYCIAQAGLEPTTVLLPHIQGCWNCQCDPPCQIPSFSSNSRCNFSLEFSLILHVPFSLSHSFFSSFHSSFSPPFFIFFFPRLPIFPHLCLLFLDASLNLFPSPLPLLFLLSLLPFLLLISFSYLVVYVQTE